MNFCLSSEKASLLMNARIVAMKIRSTRACQSDGDTCSALRTFSVAVNVCVSFISRTIAFVNWNLFVSYDRHKVERLVLIMFNVPAISNSDENSL